MAWMLEKINANGDTPRCNGSQRRKRDAKLAHAEGEQREAGSVGKVWKRIERRRRGTGSFVRAPLLLVPTSQTTGLLGAAAREPAAQGRVLSDAVRPRLRSPRFAANHPASQNRARWVAPVESRP
jgi:hypothetical protein